MKAFCCILRAAAILGITGCATDDFKVVDALRIGMNKEQARSTIHSYGFDDVFTMSRPEDGWKMEAKDIFDLQKQASGAENYLMQPVASIERYPVGHGLFGWGELFLFYDNHDRLMYFYRYIIN